MQSWKAYPINDLLDFLDPTFPERVRSGRGFAQSVLFQSGLVDIRAVQKELGAYLKEWINSGFQSDGSERPFDRNFAPKSCRDVWSFEDRQPNLLPPPKSIQAIAKFCGGSLMVRGTSYLVVGHEEEKTSGSTSMSIGPQGGIEYEPTFGSVSNDPELIAAGLFLTFYRSEWLFRLMQCRNCSNFAVPNRRPRNCYVRGWFCSKCRKAVSATAAVRRSRKFRRQEWFDLAVAACNSLSALRRKRIGSDRIAQITAMVNRDLPYMNRIKRNTIARNMVEIERAAAQKS